MKYKLKKINNNKVIFTDGLIGGGKTLIAGLVSSFKNIDPWIYDSNYEKICSYNYIGDMSLTTSSNFILKTFNEKYYDNLILRHANFRKFDVSSILNHPRKKILERLNISDNEAKKILNKTQIINHYMLHMCAASAEPIFKSFNKDLLYILVLRNPLNIYSIHHISNWTKKWSRSNGRHSMITLRYKNINIPYLVNKKRYEAYFKANSYERAILIIDEFFRKYQKIHQYKNNYKSKLIIIKFDEFIKKPHYKLKEISKFLKAPIDQIVKKQIKKNSLPRRGVDDLPKNLNINSNLMLSDYYRGFFPNFFINNYIKKNKSINNHDVLNFLKKKIRSEYIEMITKIKKSYEKIK